jgi:hypothetical protein
MHPSLGSMSITKYRPGERLVELAHRVATIENTLGTEIFHPKTLRTGFFRRRSILRTSAATPCRSCGCYPPPSCLASSLTPMETRIPQGWTTARERLALALLSGISPPVPTHRVPPLIRPYLFSPKSISQTPPLPPCRESICEYSVAL